MLRSNPAGTSDGGYVCGGKRTSRYGCAAVRDTLLPRGLRPQWEWQRWWCHQNGPLHDVLENDIRLWGHCRFSKQWSMATPLRAVHNSQQHGERTWLRKKKCGKKEYGLTINNERQMVFYTSWLAMQGDFCFSYYTLLGFFLIEF